MYAIFLLYNLELVSGQNPPGKALATLLKEGRIAEGVLFSDQDRGPAEAFLAHFGESRNRLLKRVFVVMLYVLGASLLLVFVPKIFAPADTLLIQRILVVIFVSSGVWYCRIVRRRHPSS